MRSATRRPVADGRVDGDGQRARRRVGRRRAGLGRGARTPELRRSCTSTARPSARPGRKMGHSRSRRRARPRRWRSPGRSGRRRDADRAGRHRRVAGRAGSGTGSTTAAEHIDDAAGHWWFLAVVGGIALADSILPVAPSETVVIIAGVAVATGTAPYPLWLLILVAAGGAFLGDNVSYGIGHLFGGRLQRRADRKPTFAHKLAGRPRADPQARRSAADHRPLPSRRPDAGDDDVRRDPSAVSLVRQVGPARRADLGVLRAPGWPTSSASRWRTTGRLAFLAGVRRGGHHQRHHRGDPPGTQLAHR